MRPVTLGQPIGNSADAQLKWNADALREIERASYEESENLPLTLAISKLEYFAKADVEGARFTSATERIRLTYPHGSMILKRQASAPAHGAYAQSTDGGYYVFESGVMVPELLGADPTSGTDNTAAMILFAAAMNALNPPIVRFAKSAVYDVCSTDAIITGIGSVCMVLQDIDYFEWDQNGASFRVRGALAAVQPSFLTLERCTHFQIRGFKGTQDKTPARPYVSFENYQTIWITLIDGCTDFEITDIDITNGVDGVAIARRVNTTEAAIERGLVTGYFASVFYPLSMQLTGWDIKFDLVTDNAGRSLIAYGDRFCKGRIYSTPSNYVQDIALEGPALSVTHAADNPVSEGMQLEYISPAQLASGGPAIAIVLKPATDGPTNYLSMVKGFDIKFDITPSVAGFTQIAILSSLKYTAGVLVSGDVANQQITGKIHGEVRGNLTGAANSFDLGSTTFGFSGNCLIDVEVQVTAPQMTGTLLAGKFSDVLFNRCDVPAASITQEAGASANRFAVIHSRSSDHADRYTHLPNQV